MSDDALIEAMARALCKSQGRNPDHVIVASNPEYPWWHASVADATAALAAIRKTHAVVPRDPSEAMVIAMVDEWDTDKGTIYLSDLMRKCYRAMLSAGENHDASK